MFYFPNERYLAPKWQARVVPSKNAFTFKNGVVVNTLWELKQALRIIREDIIAEHVNDSKHELADWIEHKVGDSKLAAEMRKTTHRWGMIVALERQLMRTLSLPRYVAERWLQTVEYPFYFVDGKSCNSLQDLKHKLEEVSDETVAFHLERDPNDIAKWVDDIIGDYVIAGILCEATNRSQMLTFISDHIVMLEEALTCD